MQLHKNLKRRCILINLNIYSADLTWLTIYIHPILNLFSIYICVSIASNPLQAERSLHQSIPAHLGLRSFASHFQCAGSIACGMAFREPVLKDQQDAKINTWGIHPTKASALAYQLWMYRWFGVHGVATGTSRYLATCFLFNFLWLWGPFCSPSWAPNIVQPHSWCQWLTGWHHVLHCHTEWFQNRDEQYA